MMTQKQEKLYMAIRLAVLEAISIVGVDGVREMSMFPSSKWNNLQDNQKSVKKAA